MSHKEKQGCPDDCSACNTPLLRAVYGARTICAVVAVTVGAAGLIWDVTWVPVWIAAGGWVGITAGLWAPCVPLWFEKRRLVRHLEKQRIRLEGLQRQKSELEQEKIQLQILYSQRQTEIAQRQAYVAALRAESLEMERLLAQRRLEQEAREARQCLELACAAIEADRLEAAAWRMEVTAKQLELKLQAAELFESLAQIEDNAQERILRAYETGHEHGTRGIVIAPKFGRHLRIVEESA